MTTGGSTSGSGSTPYSMTWAIHTYGASELGASLRKRHVRTVAHVLVDESAGQTE
jgi:hypothetical protein